MVSFTLWVSPWITDSFLLALARPGLFAPSRTPAMHSERSGNSWKPFVNMHNVLQVTGLLSVLSMSRWRNLGPWVKKSHCQDWKEHVVACVTIKKGYDASFAFYSSNGYLEKHFLIFLLQTKHLPQTLHIDSHICCCVLPICLFHCTIFYLQSRVHQRYLRQVILRKMHLQSAHWWKFSLLDPLRISKVWKVQFFLRKGLPTQTQHHCA